MILAAPFIWTPPKLWQPRNGAWYRKPWRAATEFLAHLGTKSGHLTYKTVGGVSHLSTCSPAIANCYQCKTPGPEELLLTYSGATPCTGGLYTGDPNGTFVLTFRPQHGNSGACGTCVWTGQHAWPYTNNSNGLSFMGHIAFMTSCAGNPALFFSNANDSDAELGEPESDPGNNMLPCTQKRLDCSGENYQGGTMDCASCGPAITGRVPFIGGSGVISPL